MCYKNHFFDDFVHKTFAQFILQAKIEELLVALCDGRPCIINKLFDLDIYFDRKSTSKLDLLT